MTEQKLPKLSDLREITVQFDDDTTYTALTDGTEWNGFPNVWLSDAEWRRLVANAALRMAFDINGNDSEGEPLTGAEFGDLPDFDAVQVGLTFMDTVYDLARMTPDSRGLYCFGGGVSTPTEVK